MLSILIASCVTSFHERLLWGNWVKNILGWSLCIISYKCCDSTIISKENIFQTTLMNIMAAQGSSTGQGSSWGREIGTGACGLFLRRQGGAAMRGARQAPCPRSPPPSVQGASGLLSHKVPCQDAFFSFPPFNENSFLWAIWFYE